MFLAAHPSDLAQRAPLDGTVCGVDTALLVIVVVTALIFDFTNGFHDTANAMATSIATGALKPRAAVALSAVLNLVGAFLSISVAATIASGIVEAEAVTPSIVFAGLIGAIAWNLITWYLGMPSSSSHALIGGVVGATLVAVGTDAVKGTGIVSKVLLPALFAPLIAGLVATLATYAAYRLTKRVRQPQVENGFRYGQIASASLLSLAHGTNDAQKTMGVITLALIAGGTLAPDSDPPFWVIVSAALALSFGTYVGGWRVIRTLGKGLTDIHAPQGFAADSSSGAVILAATTFGIPLSTTHVCSGGIIGSGIGRRLATVRWGIARRMVLAWLVTLPAAALVGAAVSFGADLIGGGTGIIVMAVLGVVFAIGMFVASRRRPVNHRNINDDYPYKDSGPAPKSDPNTGSPESVAAVTSRGGDGS